MSTAQELRGLLRVRVLQLFALVMLLAGVAWRSFQLKFSVLDLDIWWHLKVGDWIVQHLAVPHTGILSRTAAGRPWVAYSWGYEVMLSRAFAWFGLLGVGVFGTLLTVAVAFGVYWMARQLSGRFWVGWLLAAVTCCAFLFDMMPRPGFLSIVLFTVTLALILKAQRSGQVRTLYWLPAIFLCWANLHIQFIYGLFLVGLLLGVNLVQRAAARLGMEIAILALAHPACRGSGGGLRRVRDGYSGRAEFLPFVRSYRQLFARESLLLHDRRTASVEFSRLQ